MNSNTSLSTARIDELIAEASDTHDELSGDAIERFARLVEAEVRSLRSPGWIHPVVHETLQREADRLNNELAALRQPIASDVVAAPDALSRHGSVEAESHLSPRNTLICRVCGTDRAQKPCGGNQITCPMRGYTS